MCSGIEKFLFLQQFQGLLKFDWSFSKNELTEEILNCLNANVTLKALVLDCSTVQDQDIEKLVEKLPRLEELKLMSADKLTDKSCQAIANLHNLRRLKILDSKCITDQAFEELKFKHSNLEVIRE
jgi:hypothetical protein